MFGYNVLSDLKTGELVTPLRKENGQIICLTQSGLEAVFDFEDFDFDKAPEERVFVVIDPDAIHILCKSFVIIFVVVIIE